MRRRLKLDQQRGSWIAVPGSEVARRALDPWTRIPVILNDGDGRFDFRNGIYRTGADPEFGKWWLDPAREEWRQLLMDGAPFLLRQGFNRETRTAGTKIAVFECKNPEFGEDSFSFQLGHKIGEAE